MSRPTLLALLVLLAVLLAAAVLIVCSGRGSRHPLPAEPPVGAPSRPPIEALATNPAEPRTPLARLALSIRLLDRRTNAPVGAARVEVCPIGDRRVFAEARGDAEGRIRLELEPVVGRAGTVVLLHLSGAGYESRWHETRIDAPGSDAHVDLGCLFLDAVAAAGRELSGRVVDEVEAPVADAKLYLGEDPLYPLADARYVGRTDEQGRIVLDELVPPAEQHNAHHLFVVAGGRLAWARIVLPEGSARIDVGTLELARETRLLVSVVDANGFPQSGAVVEARARFYPLGGLFDARQPGFEPEAALVDLFRARADGLGHAWFEHLPAPHVASIYELVAEIPGVGSGSALLERSGAGPDSEVVLTVQ